MDQSTTSNPAFTGKGAAGIRVTSKTKVDD